MIDDRGWARSGSEIATGVASKCVIEKWTGLESKTEESALMFLYLNMVVYDVDVGVVVHKACLRKQDRAPNVTSETAIHTPSNTTNATVRSSCSSLFSSQ